MLWVVLKYIDLVSPVTIAGELGAIKMRRAAHRAVVVGKLSPRASRKKATGEGTATSASTPPKPQAGLPQGEGAYNTLHHTNVPGTLSNHTNVAGTPGANCPGGHGQAIEN